jgi:hypothetical protein
MICGESRDVSFDPHSASMIHLKSRYETVQELRNKREDGRGDKAKKFAAREI